MVLSKSILMKFFIITNEKAFNGVLDFSREPPEGQEIDRRSTMQYKDHFRYNQNILNHFVFDSGIKFLKSTIIFEFRSFVMWCEQKTPKSQKIFLARNPD